MIDNGQIWCKLSVLVMVYIHWRTPTFHLEWDLMCQGLKVRGPKVRGPMGQGLMALESSMITWQRVRTFLFRAIQQHFCLSFRAINDMGRLVALTSARWIAAFAVGLKIWRTLYERQSQNRKDLPLWRVLLLPAVTLPHCRWLLSDIGNSWCSSARPTLKRSSHLLFCKTPLYKHWWIEM